MRNRLILPLLLALPACAGGAEERPESTGALPGPVSYEVRSWGSLLVRWQIEPDGSGEIWRGQQRKGGGEIRKYRLRLEGRPLRAFAGNMEEAREATRGGIDCRKEIFDLPYGSVSWDYPGGRQTYDFDAGCRSDDGDAVLDTLAAATTIVETLASIEADPYMIEPASPR